MLFQVREHYSYSLTTLYSSFSNIFCSLNSSPRKAVNPPGTAREDWKIVRALSEIADNKLPHDNVYALRTGMGRVAPHLLKDGEREEANFFSEAAKLSQVRTKPDL